MAERILFVDDEQALLNGIQRRLGLEFDLVTASSGEEALREIEENGPFAVAVTDMRMPQMDGIQFIENARKIAPDTVYIMLTGNQDLATATQAVNDGQVFRFLNKPCESQAIKQALDAGLRQYQLVAGEKELLHQTFVGAVSVLTDVLEIAQPEVFSQAPKIEQIVRELRSGLDIEDRWEYKLSARLGLLGFALLPEQERLSFEYALPSDQNSQAIFLRAASIACRVMERIPRLRSVAQIIGNQDGIDGNICCICPTSESDIVHLGATLLRIAVHWNCLTRSGMSNDAALIELKLCLPKLLPQLEDILLAVDLGYDEQRALDIAICDLQEGMILHDDVITKDGATLLRKGRRLTWMIIEKLRMHRSEDKRLRSIRVVESSCNVNNRVLAAT